MKNENSKIDVSYKALAEELQLMKSALMNEMKYSSAQVQALYQELASGNPASSALEQEIRYGYKQSQNIYEGLSAMMQEEVVKKIEAIDDKMTALEQLLVLINDMSELKYNYQQLQTVYESLSSLITGEIAPKIAETATKEDIENVVDYERITADVGDRMLEIIADIKAGAEEEEKELIDYERIAGDTAAKVVESLPYAEPVDYNQIGERVESAVIAALVGKMAAPEIDYDKLAERIAEKMATPAVDYDKLADAVVEKIAAKGLTADVVVDEVGVEKIASAVAEKTDYTRIAAVVSEKLDGVEQVIALDDEGIDKIVSGIADELRNMTLVCEYEEMPAEEIVQEEIPVEEVVEEIVQEEIPVNKETEAEKELASTAFGAIFEEDMDGQLIDAETGLVVRLKRSFTAKMKQSEEQVKAYYSDIKNALTSYKRINSNVSWHGDRFNYGRETIAKMGINGKTLCFYLALDPNDEQLKSTVYHQKDVGAQKAYESTPFMVKVKSDAAAKKALRLVTILAEKLGAEQDEAFQEVDYVAEFAYASTKRLYEDGDIKATKEKKVDFNF